MLKYCLYILFLITCLACQQGQQNIEPSNDLSIQKIDYDTRLKNLNIKLPIIKSPIANYKHITQSGKTLYLAGKGPKDESGKYIKGKLGADMTVDEGYAAARAAGIQQLAVLKNHLGDLNKVKQVLKVQGMVNASSSFENHPEVINGFSDLMVEVFGDRGKHARAAIGMASLPRNICVEIDMIVEVY